MSRASRIIVLCEDRLQEVFVCRFLKQGWGIRARDIHVVSYPCGSGAAEKHVRDKYPSELRAYRARSAKAATILIVVIDADANTVQNHHRELDSACERAQSPVGTRQAAEAVVYVIPKWHIETWLAYLAGVDVNEEDQYKRDYAFRACESECHVLVDKLAEACKCRQQLEHPPDSLAQACDEFHRIRSLL